MHTIQLNNGIEMPVSGYGLFQVPPQEAERCATDALETGYRLIDTAQAYGNEEGAGQRGMQLRLMPQNLIEYVPLEVSDLI